MSLSSSLFSGISGLTTLGNSMTVIGDNIANVNTVGFKASRVTFQDVLGETMATTAGTAQVGRGTAISDISSTFSQGSFESTDSSTDLAVGGSGFFIVRDPNNESNEYYTRAGEFRFDKDGNLVNPAGYIVRGWSVDEGTGEAVGAITDVRVSSFTSPASVTDKMSVIVNLDANGVNNSSGTNTALSGKWDGDNTSGKFISDDDYEFQTTMKIYDSLGNTHDVMMFVDLGEAADDPVWEYIVTCNPSEDKRTITNNDDKGLLARGTIEFNRTSGLISGMANSITCAVNNGDGTWTELANAEATANGGYFCVNPEVISGSPMSVKLDFGARYNGSIWINDGLSTSQYASPFTTVYQSANGYSAGDLESITVGTDGVITGQYSNRQVLPLFRVALAKFQNEQGLDKVGGNIFRETRLSGEPIMGKAGTSGLGNIYPNSLEQSNVDIATEFVRMITTQRAFQANSKIITVIDQMLADLINLKR